MNERAAEYRATAPLSDDRLAEIRKRAIAASPAPWQTETSMTLDESVHYSIRTRDTLPEHPWSPRYVAWLTGALRDYLPPSQRPRATYCESCKHVCYRGREVGVDIVEDEQAKADAAFLAHARTDIPDLLAEVDALRAERDAAQADAALVREALAWVKTPIEHMLMDSVKEGDPPWPQVENQTFASALTEMCERHGFGAVMQFVAYVWQRRDPIAGFVHGPCLWTVEQMNRRAETALAAPNPGAALVEAADAMAGALDELAIHYIGKTGGLDRGDDHQDPVIYMAQRAIDQYRAARSAAGGGEGE